MPLPARKPTVKEYLRLVLWQHGGGEVAGRVPAFTGLLVIAGGLLVKTSQASTLSAVAGWAVLSIAAVLIAIIAPHQLWREERNARIEAEQSLYAQANMKGTIVACILQYNPLEDQSKDGSGLRFKCQCANYGQKPCEISRASLALSGEDFPEVYRVVVPLPPASVKIVDPGQQFVGSGNFTLRGITISQLSRSNIIVQLIDSLEVEYHNTTMKIVWGPEFDRL
jgi:hypothetical protein